MIATLIGYLIVAGWIVAVNAVLVKPEWLWLSLISNGLFVILSISLAEQNKE